jgi:hypothetical protein
MYSGKIAVPPGGGGIVQYINTEILIIQMGVLNEPKKCHSSEVFA